jgi:hypothetical protein
MASDQQVAQKYLQPGESIILVQRGAVMTAAIDPSGGMFPIDNFGTAKGWLAVTDGQRVTYGYLGGMGGAKWGGSFGFTGWKDDPRGVAFINEGIGPEDICIFVPKSIAPGALHGQMAVKFGPAS